MRPDPVLQVSFYSLAFELLGIEGLPLPRTNWHLKEGQDGYDDPYLTDEDYQTLCNIACEHVPGMTAQVWRDSTLGQRVAILRTTLEKQAPCVSENSNVASLQIAAHDLLAFLGGLKRLVNGYCDDLACDDPTRREQRLAASEKVIGEWREREGSIVASLRDRLLHTPVRRFTPVVIDDRSRKSATGWLIDLGDLACTAIVNNERWREQIDIQCKRLAKEMSIDFERLWAEIGIELDLVADRKEATKMMRPDPSGKEMGMIKVLLLSANPIDDPLGIDAEFRAIDAKIRGSEHRDHVQLINHGAVRFDDIPSLLMRHKPHVIHFSGHGNVDGIALTTADGSSKVVPPNALAKIFKALKDNVRVVLLNACDSAPQAEAIVSVIDCAVGMSGEIEDDAAIAFAAAFYEALGYGRSVQAAFDLALVQLEGAGEDRSLAKLYKRRGSKPADITMVNPPRPQ